MQSDPRGAQCAIHPGIGANFVCARCGNFMCASCSHNGSEQQCPTCRSLFPIDFPYDANADLSTLWGHTSTVFQRELAMCVVAAIVFMVFAFAGGLASNVVNSIIGSILGINVDSDHPFANVRAMGFSFLISQVVGTVINLAVQGVALVGFYRLLMDVLVGKKADISRMFSQLHLLPQYIVLQIILFFVITIPTLIYFGMVALLGARMVGVSWRGLSDFRPEQLLSPALLGLFGLFAASFVVYMVAMVVVLPVTLFATPELIVGQCGPVEALKRAWELGEGQRLRTCGYSFVVGVLIIAGVMACCVGIVVAIPVAYMLLLSLFLALRKSSSLPPAIHT